MNSDSKFFIGVLALAVVAIGAIIFFSTHKSSTSSNIDLSQGQKIGPDNAKVKIVEFGDFECPACAAAASGVRAVQQKNADVQLVFRNFPLKTIHKNALISAQSGQAAALQGKFWEYYDMMYANQNQWADNNNPQPLFDNYATKLGMDVNQFNKDMNSDAVKKVVDDDYNYALSIGLNQTPTFYVNNKQYVGVMTADQWNQALTTARNGG